MAQANLSLTTDSEPSRLVRMRVAIHVINDDPPPFPTVRNVEFVNRRSQLAPRLPPPLNPPASANPTARTNSRLDKAGGNVSRSQSNRQSPLTTLSHTTPVDTT